LDLQVEGKPVWTDAKRFGKGVRGQRRWHGLATLKHRDIGFASADAVSERRLAHSGEEPCAAQAIAEAGDDPVAD
jgi:hypothetical protein